ncbi:MAG: choice-of-anchor Q domain-containing protein, partial [Solirubrobacterales bacterium]
MPAGPGGTEGGEGFYLYGPGGAASTFRNLTIQDSDYGGIVAAAGGGPLVVENVAFENNLGGGIQAGSSFEQIAVEVSGSTFSGNATSWFGSAVLGFGPVTMVNSTVSGNGFVPEYGEVDYSAGGTIVTLTMEYEEDPSGITLRNVTLAGNDSGPSPALATLCLGKGLCSEGPENPSGDIEVYNSIVAEEGAGCGTPYSGVILGAGNVIQDSVTGCDDLLGGPAPSLEAKVSAAAIDLGPLLLNAPGLTATMALGSDSVALGAAVADICPETDQRGEPRPADACDSGAFQRSAAPVPVGPALKASVGTAKKVRAGKTA